MKLHRGRGCFVMSAARHDKIGRRNGSGPRPSIVPVIGEKIIALRLFYTYGRFPAKKRPYG